MSRKFFKRIEIKKYLKIFFRYLPCVILLPVCWLSRIFPRNNKFWVFGAWFGTRYSDNARYLFEYVQHDKEIKAIWITKNKDLISQIRRDGNNAFLASSPLGIYYMLRAGVAIVSSGLEDLNGALIFGAFKVNLWHGAPMKKLNFDENIFESEKSAKKYIRKIIHSILPHIREIKIYDFILTTSDYFKPIMASAFNISNYNVHPFGYPRNDILFDENYHSGYMEKLKGKYNCKNIIAYLPTYRANNNQGENFELFSNGLNRKAMEAFLKETDSVLFIKLHYVEQELMKNKHCDIGSRIIYADEKEVADINDVLQYIDVLITDYSGVYFDYLLLNRPVIFLAFDLEEYIEQRGLYNDYEFYISGPVAKNWSEVIEHAEDALVNPGKFEKLRSEKNKIFNKYYDGKSSIRVFEYLKDYENRNWKEKELID
jgi:CDP-glycerol glycerophosphotransferase (TagB/SpsB family)